MCLGLKSSAWLMVAAATCLACDKGTHSDLRNDQNGAGAVNAADGTPNASNSLRRLTNVQYHNTIGTIFGPLIVAPTLTVTDLAIGGLTSAGASQVGMPSTDAEGYVAAAYNIAQQVADPAFRGQLPCTPSSPNDSACMERLVQKYGPRLMHRPLSDAQVQTYVALGRSQALANNDFYRGVAAAVAGLLMSPSFLFRMDTAQNTGSDPDAFDAFTKADRLSYLLWNSAPDDALWLSAQDGSLLQLSVYQSHVQRLLDDPQSDAALMGFMAEVLQLDDIFTAQKDPNTYTPDLAQDLHTQAVLTVQDLLFAQNADYRQLFVAQDFFVNQNLAALYGFPAIEGTEFVKTHFTANDRAGLFGLPGITTMLSPSSRTSPTKRGIYVRSALMCTTIPSPPATVNTAVTSDANNPRTMRDLMSAHAQDSACSGCHNLMDPLGFALDDFDWLGQYRASDHNLPLDLSGILDGHSFVNARTFGQALHDNAFVTQCLVNRFITHAQSQAPAPESTQSASLHGAFVNQGYRIKELARALLLSASFTHAP